MRVMSFVLTFLIVATNAATSQENYPSKDEVMQALQDHANYTCNVLLDENGKSRCDYSLLDGKWFDYEPAWHTGQLIYGLVEAYKLTKDERYLAAAKKAGDWWTSLEIKDNPKLNGMLRAIHGDGLNYIVCATVTDGTPGLFDLYRLTKEKKYAQAPTDAGEWMMKNFYLPKEGMMYDLADPVTGEVLTEKSPFWPDKEHQTLNDVARPNNEGFLYKDMFEYTGDVKYKDVFINLCQSLVDKQGPEGLWMQFMPNNAEKGTVHPRFNLWYAESLIEGYDLTGNKTYLEAAKKTLELYAKLQKKDGTIFYENHLDGTYNQSSVTGSAVAYAGILWIRLKQLGVGDEFDGNIERSIRWILANRFSPDHPDKNLAGAALDIRTRTKKGHMYITIRDVGTSFAMRFLAAYYNYRYGAK
ncbi:MAG TPA: glycoside hydrolase family 88 protein [Bacteroidota bacterium]|nr:glycoside hydrolase family 88 protein [Bacteroidota bacterium]